MSCRRLMPGRRSSRVRRLALACLIDGVAEFYRGAAGGLGEVGPGAGVDHAASGVDQEPAACRIESGLDRCGQVTAVGADTRHEDRRVRAPLADLGQLPGVGGADDEPAGAVAALPAPGALRDPEVEGLC